MILCNLIKLVFQMEDEMALCKNDHIESLIVLGKSFESIFCLGFY